MNNYRPIYSLFKNLYCENSPILIESGVLYVDAKSGKSYINLSIKNLSNLTISSTNVTFILQDEQGQEIGLVHKQYLDVRALSNQSFASNDASFFSSVNVRQFDVRALYMRLKEVSQKGYAQN